MTTLLAVYDLSRNPPTWNIVDFLLMAEIKRLSLGLDRIEVRVKPGPADGFRRDTLPPYGGAERTRWLDNIVMPLPRALPSCGVSAKIFDPSEPGHVFGKDDYMVGFHTNVTAASKGIYPFRAPPTDDAGYVTITLRETGWWNGRQSDPDTWLAIADALRDDGHRVVVVRDAAKAEERFGDHLTAPEASLNAWDRARLYCNAALNLGISNGPLWFSWFTGRPTIIFDIVHDDEPCASEGHFVGAGLPPGQQLPNARPGQRLVWEKATPDLVRAEVDRSLSVEAA